MVDYQLPAPAHTPLTLVFAVQSDSYCATWNWCLSSQLHWSCRQPPLLTPPSSSSSYRHPHGYSHNLHVNSAEGIAVSREERIYSGNTRHPGLQQQRQFQRLENRLQQNQYQSQQQPSYFYPRPYKPFVAETYGPPEVHHPQRGQYRPPPTFGVSQHHSEVMYDPNLITGPQAAQYVGLLFSRGELFFHLIPHERLVLMNQQERIENRLTPHLLASIRPGHPFFFHR
ncbi:uncharacterized protein LOC124363554 [Homalodisca vitripennis]|uniref:uncharacterized protein LOC124363554 n=1 Tax=Homalodisca vitripennis TaxID=197043 RepID=UPI001EE9D6C3|nr:uncharacterized protein LOC124363554 [Homalodisca vitripennis]